MQLRSAGFAMRLFFAIFLILEISSCRQRQLHAKDNRTVDVILGAEFPKFSKPLTGRPTDRSIS
jgi:hypothetical protein